MADLTQPEQQKFEPTPDKFIYTLQPYNKWIPKKGIFGIFRNLSVIKSLDSQFNTLNFLNHNLSTLQFFNN